MYLRHTKYSLLNNERQQMKYKLTANLVVICITLLAILFLFKDSLCDVHFQNKEVSFNATFVTYEVRK